ncbi:SsgA family sporulation/cell division regulator [Streptomyces sp. Tu102]|nr:SsgA family sporulation/cell division regulator [Streptomyces sp. Tu102]
MPESSGMHWNWYRDRPGPVSWDFARDLLAEGTVRPIGHGDVRSSRDSSALSCPRMTGYALLTMPVDEVTRLLGGTYLLVLAGLEEASLDLNSELSWLLGEVA